MQEQIYHLQYAMDTFYFLICGVLVMWMAAGFSMLEAGLVRAKNTTEILTKNVALYSIACIMYLVCGYAFMYGGEFFLSGIGGVDVDADEADAGMLELGLGRRREIGEPGAHDEHDVGLQRFGVTARRGFERQHGLLALHLGLGDLGLQLEFDALLLEDLVRFLANVAVHAGQDLVEIFDHSDLRP